MARWSEGSDKEAQREESQQMRRSIAEYQSAVRATMAAYRASLRRVCVICEAPAFELPDGTVTATCHAPACMARWLRSTVREHGARLPLG